MNAGYWVTLSNTAGEIDRAFAKTEDEIQGAIVQLLNSTASFHAGDKIEVVEGESES